MRGRKSRHRATANSTGDEAAIFDAIEVQQMVSTV